jgi:hypothetical protein
MIIQLEEFPSVNTFADTGDVDEVNQNDMEMDPSDKDDVNEPVRYDPDNEMAPVVCNPFP